MDRKKLITDRDLKLESKIEDISLEEIDLINNMTALEDLKLEDLRTYLQSNGWKRINNTDSFMSNKKDGNGEFYRIDIPDENKKGTYYLYLMRIIEKLSYINNIPFIKQCEIISNYIDIEEMLPSCNIKIGENKNMLKNKKLFKVTTINGTVYVLSNSINEVIEKIKEMYLDKYINSPKLEIVQIHEKLIVCE